MKGEARIISTGIMLKLKQYLRMWVAVHTVIAEKNHWWWSVGRTHIVKENKENKVEQLLSVYYVVEDGRHFIDRAYPAETPPSAHPT